MTRFTKIARALLPADADDEIDRTDVFLLIVIFALAIVFGVLAYLWSGATTL